jgi:hypothetical protein
MTIKFIKHKNKPRVFFLTSAQDLTCFEWNNASFSGTGIVKRCGISKIARGCADFEEYAIIAIPFFGEVYFKFPRGYHSRKTRTPGKVTLFNGQTFDITATIKARTPSKPSRIMLSIGKADCVGTIEELFEILEERE